MWCATLHFQERRKAALLRHSNWAEITVFTGEQKPYPVGFCAGAKAIRYSANMALS